MDKPPSKVALATTWAALALTIALLAYGIVRYGLHPDVHPQFWSDIAARLHGPMTFRFILQPTMG